jgi:hypothetical protein
MPVILPKQHHAAWLGESPVPRLPMRVKRREMVEQNSPAEHAFSPMSHHQQKAPIPVIEKLENGSRKPDYQRTMGTVSEFRDELKDSARILEKQNS